MLKLLRHPLFRIFSIALPFGAIALARVMSYSNWASENEHLAAVIFAWFVTDTLLLTVIAKAPAYRPEIFQIIGAIALSSIIILFGASEPLRAVYFGFPEVLFAAGATALLFAIWSAYRVTSRWQSTGSLLLSLESVLPRYLLRTAINECQVLWLGLFRWRAPVDVPAGARAFSYHEYLTPMVATFLGLQLIELSVVHLLLMLWNPLVAWIVLAVSAWGVIWTIALLKSFRLNPVLLTQDAIRIRSGMIYDFEVPFNRIEYDTIALTSDDLSDKQILNLAILSSPNVSLRFTETISITAPFGRTKEISGVALRLSDNASFLKAVGAQMVQPHEIVDR